MGQYHLLVNLDRCEYITPYEFGAGLKQWEQTGSDYLSALHVLIAGPTPRGGGDYPPSGADVLGRWQGDRIALVGDYAEEGDFESEGIPARYVYTFCQGTLTEQEYLDWIAHIDRYTSEEAMQDVDVQWFYNTLMNRTFNDLVFTDITAEVQDYIYSNGIGYADEDNPWKRVASGSNA